MATDNVIRLKPVRPCPICGKPSVQAFHPFCSARCTDVDLNRWLSGAYVIPGPALADAGEGDEDVPDTAPPAAGDED